MPRANAGVGGTFRVALALAGVGGFVDGVGYLVLFHLFASHMSGNSITMGVGLGEGAWAVAFHHAFPIPLFVAGVVLGAALKRPASRSLALPLGLEAGLLLTFMAWGRWAFDGSSTLGWRFYLPASLPPLAMGLQSATLRRIGDLGMSTTFISGMLTNLGEELVRLTGWLYRHRRGHRLGVRLRLMPRQRSFRHMAMLLSIWGAYVGGAVVGAAAHLRWGLICLTLPACCLLALAARDLLRCTDRGA